MSRFRKKPIEVEAIPVSEVLRYSDEDWNGLPDWYTAAYIECVVVPTDLGTVVIHTLEGMMTASSGDWLIRGIAGEIYPCKPDIFEATYEAVTVPEVVGPEPECKLCGDRGHYSVPQLFTCDCGVGRAIRGELQE